MKNIKEVKKLINKQYLSKEEIIELEKSKFVSMCLFCGYNGLDRNHIWVAIKLVNGEEYSVYIQ